MSRKSTILMIEPPVHATDAEKLEVEGFSCPFCSGRGGWVEQVGYGKYLEHRCKVCDGTKKIKAVITIGWLPDYKNSLSCVKE